MNNSAQLEQGLKYLSSASLKQVQQKVAEAKQRLTQRPEPQVQEAGSRAASALRWTVKSENGQLKVEALANTSEFDVTSISTLEESTAEPAALKFAGYTIDLKAKISQYSESYAKNYMLTKSHNYMVAKFAELKTAFFGALLSAMGVEIDDIEKLRKKALKDAVRQNKVMLEENEYNSELLSIIGGSKKLMRRQQKIIKEIRRQLTLQAKQLGVEDQYTAESLLDVRIAQCSKILDKFNEEKFNLKYQLNCMGVN